MVSVLGHGDQARCAIRGHEQRLGARTEDTVTSLQLRAVDGEIGLVDELVRIGAVLREASDSDRNGARIGSLEVSTSNVRSATARRIRSAISSA